MNDAMNKYEVSDDLILYRGCDAKLFGNLTNVDEIRQYYVGRVVRDKGFVSTSVNEGSQFAAPVQFKIRIPHGKGRGAFISPFSRYPDEDEFLLKNSSVFFIRNVYGAGGHIWVEMDLMA